MVSSRGSAALALPPELEAHDPVWAAALNAPLCAEPPSDEELASFEQTIADFHAGRRGATPDEMRATLEPMRRDQRG